MASSGFQADVKALQKHLSAKHLVSLKNLIQILFSFSWTLFVCTR